MKPMKKKFKESEIMIAFTQYQVARSIQILHKMLDAWCGEEFWLKAPDNILDYITTVHAHGRKAKKVLECAGFKFKQGTMEVL